MASVLVVDDSVIMRKNLKSILFAAGHEVIGEASNGAQALIEYDKYKPDLVTMDITMPGMNGIDTIKKIMNKYPAAKIIVISALDQKSMVLEALENGAKHYLIKPVTLEKTIDVVNTVLKSS